jgi:hypothetical protein
MAMLANLLAWESDAAQKELEQLYNLLRSWVPWLDKAEEKDKQQLVASQQQQGSGRLKKGLQAAACVDGVKVWRTRVLGSASLVQFGGLLSAVSSLSLSPQVRARTGSECVKCIRGLHACPACVIGAMASLSCTCSNSSWATTASMADAAPPQP